jgi:hypothetical protein
MTDFETRVLGDLEVLKSQMQQIMGIGQPGRLHEIEGRLVSTERTMQRMKGVVAALGPLLAMIHIIVSYLSGKHA